MITGGLLLTLAVTLIGIGIILTLALRARARHSSAKATTRDTDSVYTASQATLEPPPSYRLDVEAAETARTSPSMAATALVDEVSRPPAATIVSDVLPVEADESKMNGLTPAEETADMTPDPFLPPLPPPQVDLSAQPTSGANDETLVDDTSNAGLMASLQERSSREGDKLTRTDNATDSAPEPFLPSLLLEEMNELDPLTSTPQDATIIDDSPLAALKATPPSTVSSGGRRDDRQSRR